MIQLIKNEGFTVLLDSISVALILGFKDVIIIKFDYFFHHLSSCGHGVKEF